MSTVTYFLKRSFLLLVVVYYRNNVLFRRVLYFQISYFLFLIEQKGFLNNLISKDDCNFYSTFSNNKYFMVDSMFVCSH